MGLTASFSAGFLTAFYCQQHLLSSPITEAHFFDSMRYWVHQQLLPLAELRADSPCCPGRFESFHCGQGSDAAHCCFEQKESGGCAASRPARSAHVSDRREPQHVNQTLSQALGYILFLEAARQVQLLCPFKHDYPFRRNSLWFGLGHGCAVLGDCPLHTAAFSLLFSFLDDGHAPRTADAPAMPVWHSHFQGWPLAPFWGGCKVTNSLSGDA